VARPDRRRPRLATVEHTWSTVPTPDDAPQNIDGLVTTSDGRLLCIDLANYYAGDHPVEEWTGGHWVVRG
jgi:hypothetical protein